MNRPHYQHSLSPRIPAAGLVCTALFALVSAPPAAFGQVRRDIDILNTVIRYIKTDYLEVPDPRKSMAGAFEGLINALDMMSGYLDKAAAAKFGPARTAPLKDVGAIIYKRPNAFPLVIGLIAGSPAEKAGVKMGDYLSALDDRGTLVWSVSEINAYLKDTAASPVKLRVIRETTTKEIPVTRADVYPQALTFTPQAGTAGILKIHHFYASARRGVAPRGRPPGPRPEGPARHRPPGLL